MIMDPAWLAIIVILIIFGSLIAISIMWFILASRRSNYRHEQIMSFIEKGEFDPTIMEYDVKYRGHKYFLWGGILFALGISVFSFLLIVVPFDMEPASAITIIVGIIPVIVGLGFLLYYFVLRRKKKSEESASSDAS